MRQAPSQRRLLSPGRRRSMGIEASGLYHKSEDTATGVLANRKRPRCREAAYVSDAVSQEGEGGTEAGLDTGSGLLGATQDVKAEACPSTELRAGFDTPGARATQGASADRSPVGRALADLGIEWKDVMAFGVHSDRIVVIEGPVGFKRTWWFPAARAEAGTAG